MMWKELVKDIKSPILARIHCSEIFIIPIDENLVYVENVRWPIAMNCLRRRDSEIRAGYDLVDWFEEGEVESVNSIDTCRCDMHTVLLRSGCQCGGK